MKRVALLFACCVLGCGVARAQAPATSDTAMLRLEEAIETSALRIVLPAGGIGQVDVRRCRDCPPKSLLVGSESRWFIGPRAVSFEELRLAMAAEPRSFVVVFYRPRTAELTRLVVLPR